MELNLQTRFRAMVNRDTAFQNLMFLVCVLFGLAMIANIQPAGDGVWFWYASFLLSGKHLYSDMHLAMQPIYVLETAACMALLGKGWLVSKLPAVLHVLAYCVALLLVVRRSQMTDRQKATVLGAAFFLSICFEGYRFDDYHVLADSFQIYSLVVLLMLPKARSIRVLSINSVVLGALSGLAVTTRLNDGGALAVGVVIAIVCLAPFRRMLSVALFGLGAVLMVLLVVRLTGDSLNDYASYSIFHAAGSKGGTGHVLQYPLHLPLNTLLWMKTAFYPELVAYACAVGLAWVFLLRPVLHRQGWRELAMAVVGVGIIYRPLHHFRHGFTDIGFAMSISAMGVLLCYLLGVVVIVRYLRWQFTGGERYAWDRREILFLIPLGQLASGSMSTGGVHLGLYGPTGVMILLLAVCSPIRFKVEWPRASLMVVAVMIILSAAYNKVEMPYSWHSYQEPPMFTAREWYRHPVYGPMVIDRELLEFIQPVCSAVDADKPQVELLSLPFPFANYFCALPPWRGYVQTFFDTASKETIQAVMDGLETDPPTWVLYQRQLANMTIHENLYNQGRPLQHRYLDEMIQHKIEDGEWHVAVSSGYEGRRGWDNTWTLMRTR